MLTRCFRLSAVVLCAAGSGLSARAQCVGEWLPGAPVPGVASAQRLPIAFAWGLTTWTPPGAPGPVLVVGGEFDTAGSVNAENLATFDGTTWSSLGGGVGPKNAAAPNPPTRVQAFATLPSGDLVVGGRFTTAGGVPVTHIARFDGSTWHAMGNITPGRSSSFPVHAITVLPNGDVVAGGNFAAAGPAGTNRIARWNGTDWVSLGGGVTNGGTGNSPVRALLTLPDGDVVAAGWFTQMGGVNTNFVARWDADTNTWSPMGAGMNSGVFALAQLPNGDIIAGGEFSAAEGQAGTAGIARWDGFGWHPMGSGTNAYGVVNAITVMPNGSVIASGNFASMSGVPGTDRAAQWDPTTSTWTPLGEGLRYQVYTATVFNGQFYAGGDVSSGRGTTPQVEKLARWDGTAWQQVGAGNAGYVATMITAPNGDVYAAGEFDQIDGVPASKIAKWNGTTWSPLGAGIDGNSDNWTTAVQSLALLPNGDLVAAGTFLSAAGVPNTRRIARWDGTSWGPLGAGVDDSFDNATPTVRSMVVRPNGDLIIGGTFRNVSGVANTRGIARWDGSSWQALGSGMDAAPEYGAYVYDLDLAPDGDVVVAGTFASAGGVPAKNVARWDGTDWSSFGNGVGGDFESADDILALPNGDVIASGGFFSVPGLAGEVCIARWNGSAWVTMPGAPYTAQKICYYNGDVVLFAPQPDTTSAMFRWNGSTWSPFAAGLAVNDTGLATTVTNDGQLWIGGAFTHVNGNTSSKIARFVDGACAVVDSAGLVLDDSTGNGNDNGLAEPGESAVKIDLPLIKTGVSADLGPVVATLSTSTPTVTVVSDTAMYSGINQSSPVLNSSPFVISVDPAHPCATPITLKLSFAVAGGSCPCELSYTLMAGVPAAAPTVVSLTGMSVAIPDNSTSGVDIPFTVSGETSPVNNLKVRFDGVVSATGANDLNTGIGHANVGDLVVRLTSPQGTTITLVNRPGTPTPSEANNFCVLTLDDQAANSIQAIGPNAQPITGSHSPAEPLSSLNGENANGVWTLNVADVVASTFGINGGQGGLVKNVSLIFGKSPICQSPSTGSVVCCRGTTCTITTSAGACSAPAQPVVGVATSPAASCGVTNNATTGCCFADFNKSGIANIDDIFIYLNAWFAASPYTDMSGDGGSAPSIDDIFLFLNTWFAGC